METTVLLVEDDNNMRMLLEHLLKRNDMQVISFEDGQSAVEYIQTNPPAELALLDLYLPFKNGFEILKELKKSESWENIPTVMITASDAGDDMEKAFRLGADDYIEKPIDTRKTIARINKFLKTNS